jgi:hypothetical protein
MSVVSRSTTSARISSPLGGSHASNPRMRDQAPTSCFAPLAFRRPSIPPAGSGAPTIGWKTKSAVLARSLAGVSSARAAASIGSPGLSVRDDTETRAAASGLGILRGFDSDHSSGEGDYRRADVVETWSGDRPLTCWRAVRPAPSSAPFVLSPGRSQRCLSR